MPNATDQPRDGSRRGTLFVLVLIATIAVGLWLYLDRSEAPTSGEGVGPTEAATDTAPTTDNAGTADSGTADAKTATQPVDVGATVQVEKPGATTAGSEATADLPLTTDAGATSQNGAPSVAEPGTGAPIDVARKSDADATTPDDESGSAVSASDAPTDVVRATDDGAPAGTEIPDTAAADDDAQTAIALTTNESAATRTNIPDTAAADNDARTTIAPATDGGDATRGETPGIPDATAATRTTDTDTEGATDTARTADSASTGDAQQPASGDATSAPARDDLVLAAAPEDTVEKAPIDAPPAAETTRAEDLLATVEGAIERIESTIREHLVTEPDSDADTKLRVQVTYDDSQKNAAQTNADSTEAAETNVSDASTPAGDGPMPDPDIGVGTPIATLTDSDDAARLDVTPPADTTSAETPSRTEAETRTRAEAETPTRTEAETRTRAEAETPARTEAEARTRAEAETPTRTEAETGIETDAEARKFVEALTDSAPETIAVDKADHFVTRERVISLVPDDTIERVTVDELAKDETLAADTPITVVREVEQIEPAVPEQLIAESGGDLDKPLRVRVTYDDSQNATDQGGSGPVAVEEDVVERVAVRDAQDSTDPTDPGDSGSEAVEEEVVERIAVRDAQDPTDPTDPGDSGDSGDSGSEAVEEEIVELITVREALERLRAEPTKPLSVIRKVRYFEVMTLRELLDTAVDSDTYLNVVTRPYRLESATLADLLQRHMEENPDSIFYLHTVQSTDDQGIWGIVHFGLIDNFARGMAIRHGKDIETYTVRIPRDADERLEDQSSSFLGKLIDRKTKDSYVYNYRDHRMGRNPDRIYPGQELVIINFKSQELMSIFRHFAGG